MAVALYPRNGPEKFMNSVGREKGVSDAIQAIFVRALKIAWSVFAERAAEEPER